MKAYNAMEILLLQAIQLECYPTQKDPLLGKKPSENINKEIRAFLKSQQYNPDTKNNRHLILFLKEKSPKVNSFLNLLVRIDLKTNWEAFFEMTSILRNIVAHHSMIVTKDAQNEINSIAGNLFYRNFDLVSDELGNSVLQFKSIHQFQTFLDYLNDFSLNTTKFLFDQADLSFIDLE